MMSELPVRCRSWPDLTMWEDVQEQEDADRMKRRVLRREKTVTSTGSNEAAGDLPSSYHEPDPIPAETSENEEKPKQKRRIWDSFLKKTRRIRVRRREKEGVLDKRSTSQPNIPAVTRMGSKDDEFNETAPVTNGKSISFKDYDTTEGSRIRTFWGRKSESKKSVVDSSSVEQVISVDQPKSLTQVSDEEHVVDEEDDGYRSIHETSMSARGKTPPAMESFQSQDSTKWKSLTEDELSLDRGEFQGDVQEEDVEEDVDEKDDTVPVMEGTLQESPLSRLGTQLISPHTYYMLNVHLKEGRDLVIRDSCGTSDPYVKFKVGNKVVYRTRTILKNLNPRWDEQFNITVEDVTKSIIVKVYDYDRLSDDPMGGTEIDVSTLEPNKETDLKLLLTERGVKEDYMGYLLMTVKLIPKTVEEKEQQVFRRSVRPVDSSTKKMKMQLWSGVVNIVLVEGKNLVPMDDNGLSDPYIKFRLGPEKYRSKFKTKTLNPKWLEQFDLRLYDDQNSLLDISVYDHDTRGKDDFMGRTEIDLSQLERDKTHHLEKSLEDGAGTLTFLLTISGTYGTEVRSDLANYTPSPSEKDQICHRYSALNSFSNISDVGFLECKVFRAHGLQAADFGGLSDPFCVLELVNDRVQTQTEYKTLNPEWAKVFTFPVKDIHSVLEVTVYDEDKNKKVEFLGKVAIPLLRIRNGERRWYALKDRKLRSKTKGAILLELDMVFNQFKAAFRTVNPREDKYMKTLEKFKIAVMKQNINRVTQLIGTFIDGGKFIKSCFDWQSPPRTITAFIVYLIMVWNFELYMLPISLLLILLKNLIVAQIVGGFKKEPVEEDYFEEEDDEDEEEKDKPRKAEEKKSIVERYHAIQEVCAQVQQALDMVACLGERVKNTFNWSVPWLSTFAVIVLLVAMIILFYIPLRIILLLWGINKFTKKLRKPDAIDNNELLDFLSRVPSDNELVQFRELRPDIPANTTSTKKKRS